MNRPLSAVVATAGTSLLLFAGQVCLAGPAGAFPGQGLVGNAVGSTFDRFFDALVGWLLGGVEFFTKGAFRFLGASSTPQLTQLWFSGPGSPVAAVRSIAALLLVAAALLAVISGVVRGDVGGMVPRVVGGIAAAVLATVAVTVVADRLLQLTDAFAGQVLDPAGPAAERFASGLAVGTATTGSGFAVALVALLATIAGLALWAELLVRAALIYTLVALAPLSFAVAVWPAARGTARRSIELLLAVILSKLVVAIVLAVGVAAVGNVAFDTTGGVTAGAGQAAGQLLVGAVLLGIAAFAPFLTLRLFPLAEAAGVAHGVSRAPVRTAISALYLTNSASRLAGGHPTGIPSASVLAQAETATRAATAAFELGRASAAPERSEDTP
jgi:hypothetical protein